MIGDRAELEMRGNNSGRAKCRTGTQADFRQEGMQSQVVGMGLSADQGGA